TAGRSLCRFQFKTPNPGFSATNFKSCIANPFNPLGFWRRRPAGIQEEISIPGNPIGLGLLNLLFLRIEAFVLPWHTGSARREIS
ncbi:hypothetical protein ABTN42_22100, partial [Acinetobacter baumannii]